MILLAILLPWLSFLVRGKIFAGIICIILQITLIGWFPAAIWAIMSYNQEKTQEKLNQIHRSISKNQTITNSSGNPSFETLSKQAHAFYDQKDYNSAVGMLQRMVALNPKENKTYFNMACCYSLLESKECFNALTNAVAHGYSNFERINIYKALEWQRKQPEFEQFLKNGYKLYLNAEEKNTTTINDDALNKLEKLGKLKEQGHITEEEFLEQKKKVLSSL